MDWICVAQFRVRSWSWQRGNEPPGFTKHVAFLEFAYQEGFCPMHLAG